MGTLDTPHQLELERAVLEALASRPVRSAVETVQRLYAADRAGSTQDGRATLESAAAAITHAAVNLAIKELDPLPRLHWIANAAHTWHGLEVPASGYGIDNPDNVHRNVKIEPDQQLTLRGRCREGAPLQQSIILYAELPGTGKVGKEGADVVDVLVRTPRPGEEFTVAVGPERRDGEHLCTEGRGRFLIVRDVLADWGHHRPSEIHVEEPHRPTSGSLDQDELATSAAELAPRIARFWLDYNNEYLWSRPANQLIPPRVRPFGAAASTTYRLSAGSSLLVTVDRAGAEYLGCEVTDPWGVTVEYVHRTGSLNQAQVVENADGTVSYAISPEDPGVHNWLDTGGLREGILTLRWQCIPDPHERVEKAVIECREVPTTEVAVLLPDQEVGPVERTQQLARRHAAYSNRLA